MNYENWQKGPAQKTFKIGEEEYTIKCWNRIPQESLFDGTYTNCCTAPDGTNGAGIANYLMNESINVVEIKDKQGNIVSMSRCFIAEVGGKNSLIIENIEANSHLVQQMNKENSTSNLVDAIFDYQKEYASMVIGENAPVYMSTNWPHIEKTPLEKLPQVIAAITFVGKISKPEVYLNTFGVVDSNDIVNKSAPLYVVRE